jgi:hypothetical protein
MRTRALIVALLAVTAASGDVLHMKDGTRREGKILAENADGVVMDFGHGAVSVQVTVPRDRIERIERKPAPADALTVEYVRRLAAALDGDADDWHALGLWCLEQRVMKQKAREAFEHALALDPDHLATHRLLGHVNVDGTWMTRDRAIRVIAPDALAEAKARDLEAQKELELGEARRAELQKTIEELKAKVAELEKANRDLLRRLASIPPPSPPPEPRVIYRPYIIYRDRPRPRHRERDEKNGEAGRNGEPEKKGK